MDDGSAILSPFLRIPAEVRLEIYRMLLTTSYAFSEAAGQMRFGRRNGKRGYEFQLGILRANRQIYNEAIGVFIGENLWITVKINIPVWAQDSFPPPLNAVARTAWPRTVHPAFRMQITVPGRTGFTTQHSQETNLIMGPEGIDAFVYQLWLMGAEDWFGKTFSESMVELTLHASQCHSMKRLQDICHATFRTVRITGPVTVNGDVAPAFRERFLWMIKTNFRSMDEIIGRTQGGLAAADKALLASNPKAAYWQFTRAKVFHLQARRSLLGSINPDLGALAEPQRAQILHFDSDLQCQSSRILLRLGVYQPIVDIDDLDCYTPEQEIAMALYIWRAHRFLGQDEAAMWMLRESLPDTQLSSITWVDAVVAAMHALYPDKPDVRGRETTEAMAAVIEHRLSCRCEE
ncbi:MAG: hypothetical protein Q9163_005466 [Psora crenata]